MKKSIVTTAAIMLAMSFTPAFAQPSAPYADQEETIHSTYPTGGFWVGIRAVPQMSWMVNSDDLDNAGYKTMNKFGAAFGLAGGYNFDDHLGVELNAFYSMEGKRYKLTGIEYTQKMDYLKIPLLFTYTTRPANFMFLGKIGPQLNILNRAKIDPAIINGGVVSDNKDHFENIAVGGAVSAGVRYAATDNIWIDASVRYDMSFTNVENSSNNYFPAGRANTYNMTTGIEIGINYLLK